MSRGRRRCSLGELALHVLQRDVDVALELELDGDVAAALARGGRDLLDALDRGDRVLDEVDDVRLHDLGRGALVGDRDVHDREVDVGVLADAEALEDGAEAGEAQDAEADEGEHQDPGEDVVADRDVRQRHPGGDLLGVLLGLRRPARLVAHAPLPTSPPAPARRLARPPAAAPPRDDLDRDPVGQAVGALGHHDLARLRGPRGSRRRPCPCAGPCSTGRTLRLAVLHHVGRRSPARSPGSRPRAPPGRPCAPRRRASPRRRSRA